MWPIRSMPIWLLEPQSEQLSSTIASNPALSELSYVKGCARQSAECRQNGRLGKWQLHLRSVSSIRLQAQVGTGIYLATDHMAWGSRSGGGSFATTRCA